MGESLLSLVCLDAITRALFLGKGLVLVNVEFRVTSWKVFGEYCSRFEECFVLCNLISIRERERGRA